LPYAKLKEIKATMENKHTNFILIKEGVGNTRKTGFNEEKPNRIYHGLMRITSVLGCVDGKRFKCSITVCT